MINGVCSEDFRICISLKLQPFILMIAKKLFYVPGLISLIGLPILIFIVHPEDKKIATVMTIRIPSDDTINTNYFTKANVDSFLKTKNIEQITLDINESYDYNGEQTSYLNKRKQAFVISEIERIKFTNDTNRILKIQFSSDNSYGDFINILNLARWYQYDKFIYANDAFYFIANDPLSGYIKPMQLPLDDWLAVPGDSPTKWDYFKWNMEAKWRRQVFEIKQSPRLSTGFLILIFIPALVKIFSKMNVRKRSRLIS